MNRSLYEYCLGSTLRRWKRPKSHDAGTIHGLILEALKSGVPNDAELLRRLVTIPTLNDDVFRLLRPLHGCGGSEGYVLGVEPAVEAEFWVSLATRFPEHQGVCYIASDAALLAGDRNTARQVFMQGFRLDPDQCSPFAEDWEELLQGTDLRFEYRRHLLAQTRHDYPDEVSEEAADLKSEFGNDPDKVKMIEVIAAGGAVPPFPEGK